MTRMVLCNDARPVASADEGGDAIEGPFDGKDVIAQTVDPGAGATTTHVRVPPAENFENRRCGFRTAETAMVEDGAVVSDSRRLPLSPLRTETRVRFSDLSRRPDPVAPEPRSPKCRAWRI